MKLLITGCCGFIGYSLTNFLLKKKNKSSQNWSSKSWRD